MKKVLFLSFAAICFAVTVNAQNGNGNGYHHHGGDQKLVQTLNLTPDQQAQFRAIDSTQRLKMQAIRNSSDANKRDEFMAAMKDGNDQKRAILTPDQQTKWDQLQAERQQRMQEMRQRHQDENGNGSNAPAPQSDNSN